MISMPEYHAIRALSASGIDTLVNWFLAVCIALAAGMFVGAMVFG